MENLEAEALDPELWSDQDRAKTVLQKKSYLESVLKNITSLEARVSDVLVLFELAEMEDDSETEEEAVRELARLEEKVSEMKIERLLSGEADSNNAFIEIHAGAGGTESQDWASMLLRMYLRWAERRGYSVEVVDESRGEEAGIKAATIKVAGMFAYGYAKNESGVHRLVRISPFDSNQRRHTSFASVFAYPEVDDSIEVTIEEKDLRIDTFRASGAGGQHVNTTDSAIRITHMPTGIVVQCQNQRSQHQNKDAAMKMLKARLFEVEMQKREAEKNAVEASKTDNAWGNQIRSYVLHPYKMVKDLRTTHETSNTDGVLDGDLDPFIQAMLSYSASKGGEGA